MVIKGDTRSLDYSSDRLNLYKPYGFEDPNSRVLGAQLLLMLQL